MFKFALLMCAVGMTMAQMYCPPGVCDTMRCADVSNCEGRLVPHGGACGCCAVCMKQLQEGENCQQVFVMDLPHTMECAEGLKCDFQTTSCIKDGLNPCHEELAQKERLLESAGGQLMGLTMPTCTDDGFYSPKQCVEAVCQCVAADGTPISNYRANVGQSAEMGCQCARAQAELEAGAPLMGRPSVQCDSLGNYRKRQCRESVCNCVDRNGQTIEGFQAHISQAPKMSCECARRNSDIVLLGENHVQYKCDEIGNYVSNSNN